ncbi:MAG: response regulator [Leptolyngbyaceae cyanobacterium CRU_2_3]|nr:response regulator [Leptolyngbyaceae cyanobacterium CRU_2_3]
MSVVDERSQGLALGAIAYLVKPITRGQLRAALEQLRHPPLNHSSVVAVSDLETVQEVSPKQNQPLILLAEDNQASIDAFSTYLDSRGYRLILAANGQEAIDLATAHLPDLILMDIQMPKMDGLEAIRRIRSNPQIAAIPIIALTALAMSGDQEKCLEAGANRYLSKPVRLKQLAEVIKNLLAQ